MDYPEFTKMAEKYNVPIDFLKKLYGKVYEKEHFECAVKMFINGELDYQAAIDDEPISIVEIQERINAARLIQKARDKELFDYKKKVFGYLKTCVRLQYPKNPTRRVHNYIYIKDGRLVAFGRNESHNGGIYAANFEHMPDFNWNPTNHLKEIKGISQSFFNQIKKAAHAEPRELFNVKKQAI